MLAAAVVLAAFSRGLLLWIAVPVPVVGVTALTALGVTLNRRGKHERPSVAPGGQKMADVTSGAGVVQRALLPPPPRRGGPPGLQGGFLAAPADAPGGAGRVAHPPRGAPPAAPACPRNRGQPEKPRQPQRAGGTVGDQRGGSLAGAAAAAAAAG